jgi:hypothetical protein
VHLIFTNFQFLGAKFESVSKFYILATSVAEPPHFYAAPAPAPGVNFEAAPAPAPAPTLLYSKAKFLKRTKV